MSRIKLLPESVANQIAAGEVVQRPASVVKELIENAIDAGSTVISVSVSEGGRDVIHVIDNGCGMSCDDAMMAFERHATSKISEAMDLYNLSTFGFRGEALASIASVAEVELRTKREEDDLGLTITAAGSEIKKPIAANIPKGTQFIVKNLFYNIPARRKFLKSNSVETKHIIAEFTRVALCNPRTEMSLINNGTHIYNLPGTNLRQRIVAMIGKHINNSLLEVKVETSIISVEGFIGAPSSAKKSSDQYLFVNNRFFKSGYIHKAIVSAYDRLIQQDVQPSYFIYLNIDPSKIDVNIHPSKTEIKFEDEQAIWQIINAAVRESLGKLGGVPLMDFENETPIDIPVYNSNDAFSVKMPENFLNPDFNPFENEKPVSGFKNYTHKDFEALYKEDYDSFDKTSAEGDSFRSFISSDQEQEESDFVEGNNLFEVESSISSPEVVKLSSRYIITNLGSEAMIIDIPRAHSRVLYEKYLDQLSTDSFGVNQQELFPVGIDVSPADRFLIEAAIDELSDAGFDIEITQDKIFLRGIPTDMSSRSREEIIETLISNLRSVEGNLQDKRKENLARIMAETRCVNSIKGLTDIELRDLVSELMVSREPLYSTRGKTTMVAIKEDDVIKNFK